MTKAHKCRVWETWKIHRHTHPDKASWTPAWHDTHLLDGVEGAHPLGPTVGQPVGDLTAAHQPLAAPEVTVFTQHPAGPSTCQRHRGEDRQRDGEDKNVRTCPTSSSLLLGLFCLELGSQGETEGLGSGFGFAGQRRVLKSPFLPGLGSKPWESVPLLSPLLPPSWMGGDRNRSAEGKKPGAQPALTSSPRYPVPPHNPLTCPPGSARTARGC